MIDDPLVRDLLAPGNLPADGPIEFVATHASFVFLTPADVFKVKRPKNYGFFDFSTLESRRHFCAEEVRLNRRTAPDVYIGVRPVFRDARGYSLTRPGAVVADYAVHMRRLPDDASARSLLRRGALTPDHLATLASELARFYSRAEQGSAPFESLRGVLQDNFEQVRPYVGKFIDRELFDATRAAQDAWLASREALLRRRETRDGHGDLRLEHVYFMTDGRTLVIDCIEFLDRLRVIDPALDVAFFAMELRHFGRRDLGETVLGRFAYETDDYDLYPLVDGYMSYRAWVRGKVATFLAADPQEDPETARSKADEALRFFKLARACIAPPRARGRLLAVAGMVGSGKTTLAEAIARRISAPLISADATRKRLAGVSPGQPAPSKAYQDDFTERVHDEILRRAGLVLESGRSVVVDSTFRKRSFRERARKLAGGGGNFVLVECRVPEEVARERLRGRTSGISDAREEQFDTIKADYEPISETPSVVVDTTRPVAELLQQLGREIGLDRQAAE